MERGPRVTRYEIHLPPGVRVSRVTNLADDLAYALSALAVRVEAPVPGKGVIGIEVPNAEVTFVHPARDPGVQRGEPHEVEGRPSRWAATSPAIR